METDKKLFKEIQDHVKDMESDASRRVTVQETCEDMYWLDKGDLADVERTITGAKITLDPTPRITVDGIRRLLTATEPVISVPQDQNKDNAQDYGEDIERMASMMWRVAGRISGRPLHYDAVLSAILYDQIVITIDSTKELLALAESATDPVKDEIKRINKMTPYLFNVVNPRSVFTERSNTGGLSCYARASMMSKFEIIDAFGEDARRVLDKNRIGEDSITGRYENLRVWDFFDREYRQVWVDGFDEPILQDEHGLPFIPVVAHTVEGSRLFTDDGRQVKPFLFTEAQSGLWKMRSMVLSAWATQAVAMGFTPPFIFTPAQATDPMPKADFSGIFGMWKIPQGATFERSKSTGIMDPEVYKYYEMAAQLGEESTMYKTALGQSIGSSAPFSAVSLLSQQGRLPTVTIKEITGWAIADALKMAFLWMRADKGEYKAGYQDQVSVIKAAEIPETFELECALEVDMPQDKLQQANIINVLAGKMPMRWLVENVLNEGQYEDLEDEIMAEEARRAFFQIELQKAIQQAQQAEQEQAAMVQGPPPGPEQMMMGGPPQGPPPMMPPGMPPELQGLPPEMAMGGMQGPLPPVNEPPPEGMMP